MRTVGLRIFDEPKTEKPKATDKPKTEKPKASTEK